MKTWRELEDEFYRMVRKELIDGLYLCTPRQRLKFTFIWKGVVPNAENEVEIASWLPRNKLESAMIQVYNAIPKEEE